MWLVPSPLCLQKSWEGLPSRGQQTTIWQLFWLVWTSLVSLWASSVLPVVPQGCCFPPPAGSRGQ